MPTFLHASAQKPVQTDKQKQKNKIHVQMDNKEAENQLQETRIITLTLLKKLSLSSSWISQRQMTFISMPTHPTSLIYKAAFIAK